MNMEEIRDYCLHKKGTTEETPFGDSTLVFKVKGKMYALLALDDAQGRLNVKCDPELALTLREEFTGVIPGFHMNKKHWNTLVFDGSFSDAHLKDWIDLSYNLVVAKLPKKLKDDLKTLS